MLLSMEISDFQACSCLSIVSKTLGTSDFDTLADKHRHLEVIRGRFSIIGILLRPSRAEAYDFYDTKLPFGRLI